MKKKVAIVTLGCPKNQVDSEVMLGALKSKYSLVENPEQANIIVINTCTFIDSAKTESINTILEMAQYKENGSCQTLVATGCLAQRYGEELMSEIPELDGVLGTGNIAEVIKLVENAQNERTNNVLKTAPDFLYDESMPRMRSTPKHYAYVKVAEGCDNFCTYCIIPSVRGHFRSRKEESIISEVKLMVQEGVKEVLLIAQDTTRYGLDLYGELRLPKLIRRIAEIEGVEWIRLMYCYPELFTDELIDTMRDIPKVCRYIDLPLQHGDNQVLAEMNRRGSAEKARDLISKIRANIPEVTIRTTMITGFPGETEAQFNNLLEFVKEIEFDRLGAFAYSQEESTPAGKREDQVPTEIREERREKLMALQYEIALRHQKRWLGQVIKVLVEEKLTDGRWLGRFEGDAPEIDGQVYINSNKALEIGAFVWVKVFETDSFDLMGEVI